MVIAVNDLKSRKLVKLRRIWLIESNIGRNGTKSLSHKILNSSFQNLLFIHLKSKRKYHNYSIAQGNFTRTFPVQDQRFEISVSDQSSVWRGWFLIFILIRIFDHRSYPQRPMATEDVAPQRKYNTINIPTNPWGREGN